VFNKVNFLDPSLNLTSPQTFGVHHNSVSADQPQLRQPRGSAGSADRVRYAKWRRLIAQCRKDFCLELRGNIFSRNV